MAWLSAILGVVLEFVWKLITAPKQITWFGENKARTEDITNEINQQRENPPTGTNSNLSGTGLQ